MRVDCMMRVLSVGILAWAAGPSDAGPLLVGQTAPSMEINGAGPAINLSRPDEAKLVVVAFLGCECPLVTGLYATRLEKISQEFADAGLKIVGIDSNLQDSQEDIDAFAKKQNLSYPIYRDVRALVADAFGATRTPEVFLLDQSLTIRYHGRIDDQGQVGYIRLAPQRHDLVEAIKEVLAGKDVTQAELAAVGCLIGRPKQAEPASTVTYSSHIGAIFQNRCLNCHRDDEIGPFSMERFDEVAGWADMIAEVVDQERMPPWFASPAHGKFSNDARLTAEEKKLISDWVKGGAPLGDPAKVPVVAARSDAWNIGKPDFVVPMAQKPFRVPAEGVLPYRHYWVDPKFTEDKWMTACEVRPGDRSVVHHVLVFCKVPGQRNILDIFNGGLIAAYAPGMPAFQSPAGVARKFPKGSQILIQMHYTVNGRPSEDLTSVGFRFCEPSQVKQEIEALGANNFFIAIPPGAPNHQIKAVYHFREDRMLVNLTPHMHMRGKSFRFEAVYPDGAREILLDVPRFDFNWQLQYNLAEAKLMPKGTQLVCTAHYDNSAGNPANPNPKQFVRFGEQTWDEMMIGWFTAINEGQKGNDVSAR
ncbi:redoxin domain-containing protein [bacterium]|nr:redoxin domain-containing protein [bacterium]